MIFVFDRKFGPSGLACRHSCDTQRALRRGVIRPNLARSLPAGNFS